MNALCIMTMNHLHFFLLIEMHLIANYNITIINYGMQLNDVVTLNDYIEIFAI